MSCLRVAVSGPVFASVIAFFLAPAAPAAWAARVAPAAAKAKKGPDVVALIKSGQAHAEAKEWPQAVADFQAALKAKPKDPVVLGELGLALLMDKQLDAAQRVAEQGLKLATTPGLKATNLYNLGRIAESLNKQSEALDKYNKSLALQHSDETVRRIYQLDEFSEALPCREARSIEAICSCISKLLGGSCAVEDDLIATVKRLRSTWTPENNYVGTASAFLVVQGAAGWSLVSHLGRLRSSTPHYLNITDMKAAMREFGARQVFKIEYTTIDNDARCMTLSNSAVKGLDREYDVECLKEARHVLGCVGEAGKPVTCPVAVQVSCQNTKSARITDEFAGVPKSIRAQVRAWEARAKSSTKGQLSLSDTGSLRGTALVGPAAGTCATARPVDYKLF